MEINKNFFEQGDVLIIKIDDFETRKKLKKEGKNNNLIIAEGETTGHAHRIQQNEYVEMYDDVDEKCILLRLLKPAKIKHEEHKEIEIPAGEYKINIVREYDHFLEESKIVRD
jgi:hypothetical protein